MFVVVVGDLDRNTEEDEQQVLDLLDELKGQFSDLTIVSAACKKGIGAFVKARCLQDKKNPDLGFVEYDVKVWTILDDARLAQVYACRNPSLLEIGEVFHIFTSGRTLGHIPDLIRRVESRGLPLAIHSKDGTRKLVNYNQSGDQRRSTNEPSIFSDDFKKHLEK